VKYDAHICVKNKKRGETELLTVFQTAKDIYRIL